MQRRFRCFFAGFERGHFNLLNVALANMLNGQNLLCNHALRDD